MNSQDLDATLHALADTTRRSVVEHLSKEPTPASALARRFGMSMPAMSRHLRLLRRTGLIEDRRVEEDARIRLYQLRRDRFTELGNWLETVDQFWTGQLQAFKRYSESSDKEATP